MQRSIDALHHRYMEILKGYADGPDPGFVLGEGKSTRPLVMLVGEAPGAQEVREGRPFVGKAGQNLAEFLRMLGLSREDIYISNVVKVRPAKQGTTGRLSNRPPTRQEVEAFTPWLLEEVALVAPAVLVTLGNTPLRVFAGKDATIGAAHGRMTHCGSTNRLFPLYHPAAIIYNRTLTEAYHQDLLQLRKCLEALPDFLA